MKEEGDKLRLLYEKEDKQGLRNGMDVSLMPLFLGMEITNGLMMGFMMSLADTNYQQFTSDVYYAYVDGSGEGFTDGSDFGGDIKGEGFKVGS